MTTEMPLICHQVRNSCEMSPQMQYVDIKFPQTNVGIHYKKNGEPPFPPTMPFLNGHRGYFQKLILGLTFEGLWEMFEGDLAEMCGKNIPLMSMACADQSHRTGFDLFLGQRTTFK